MRFQSRSLAVGLFVVLGVSAAASARAQEAPYVLDEGVGEWSEVDRVQVGAVYLDTAGIVPLGNGRFQVRTQWRFAADEADRPGRARRSSIAVRGVDCRSQEMVILAFADREGERVVQAGEQPLYAARWDPVNPNTVGERIVARTCEMGSRRLRVANGASIGG